MLEKLGKHNPSFIFSIVFHAILTLIIVSNFTKTSNKEANISVSIISQPSISQIYANKKQALNDQKKSHQNIKSAIKSSENSELAKKDQKDKSKEDQKQSINDLSYSKEIYQVGSKKNPTPPYPRMAKLRNYQGIVEICAISDVKGNVVNVEVHKSSGYSILDKSALKTIEKWQFNIQNLSDINSSKNQFYRIIVPISFVLS